jgi:hypothetical protein
LLALTFQRNNLPAFERLVCSLRLAQEWQAPVAIHPDAGHDLPPDDAGWVARQVHQWIGTFALHACFR